MSFFIKVCGLSSEAALAAALDAGADAVGFVFHAASPRNLSPQHAAVLGARVPRGVLKVAVTLHPSQALIDTILAALAPDLLQTDAADIAALRLPAGLATLPVLRSGLSPPSPLPVRCLYESAASGSGRQADWREARALTVGTRLILAGGLTAVNVAAAIAAVGPAGVDVSSGVESAPGIKDVGMIHAFVASARAAATLTAGIRESVR